MIAPNALTTLQLLRSAGFFRQDEDTEADNDNTPEEKPEPDQRVPLATLMAEKQARKDAEKAARTAKAEADRFKSEAEQLKADDKSGTLTQVQAEKAALETRLQEIETEFEGMLEAALSDLPEDRAAMVRDIPGGARAQFAYFNKHRAFLSGGATEDPKPKGVEGPNNDPKPAKGKSDDVTAATRARIEAANARTRKGTGWNAVIG